MLNTYTLTQLQHRRRVKRLLKSSPPANCHSWSSCHKRESAKLNVPQLHPEVKTAVWVTGIFEAASKLLFGLISIIFTSSFPIT